ncbi:IS66 family transposase, partial [Escherichia coli]
QLGVQLGRYTSLDPLEEVEKNASALPSPAWKTDSTKFSVVLKSGGRSIDKGIPTAGLLAHVMVAKFADHLPLYRQEKIFGRAGLA